MRDNLTLVLLSSSSRMMMMMLLLTLPLEEKPATSLRNPHMIAFMCNLLLGHAYR